MQPTSYIDPVYQITSPSTCTGSSYALAFKANSDGTAKVYANGKLNFSNVAATIEAGNGNGFEMSGTNLPGNHKLLNSTSYNNEGYLRNILLPRTLSFRICILGLHVARISCVCSSL